MEEAFKRDFLIKDQAVLGVLGRHPDTSYTSLGDDWYCVEGLETNIYANRAGEYPRIDILTISGSMLEYNHALAAHRVAEREKKHGRKG